MVHRILFSRILMLTLPLMLSSCGLNDWANTHMPVIGDRCDNWQCFTESGKQQSDANKQRLQTASTSSSTPSASPDSSATPAMTPSAPAQPLPPEPANGAYQYVPRAPAAPGTTPFDGH